VFSILASAKMATARQRCFLVDYQLPTDPHNLEIARGIGAGQIGKPAIVTSHCFDSAYPDPPRAATDENRLQRLIWMNDIALGGGHHVNSCIHALDAVLWVMASRPVRATGFSRIIRENPHSDSHDVLAVSYTFPDGTVWDHCGRHLDNLYPYECAAMIHGTTGYATVSYSGRVQLRGPEDRYSGDVQNLYQAGVVRNIAEFYRQVTEGHFNNDTVPRAVDGALTGMLSREAALRRVQLSMDDLIQENRRLQPELKGLKT
jgi:predicted dehydrogenase